MSGFLSLTIPHDKKISTFEQCVAVACASAYEETVSLKVTEALPELATMLNGPLP